MSWSRKKITPYSRRALWISRKALSVTGSRRSMPPISAPMAGVRGVRVIVVVAMCVCLLCRADAPLRPRSQALLLTEKEDQDRAGDETADVRPEGDAAA